MSSHSKVVLLLAVAGLSLAGAWLLDGWAQPVMTVVFIVALFSALEESL